MREDERQLGAIIKAARKEKNLTQKDLAALIGVGPRHLMGIENEGKSPSFEVLLKLIQELNISADTVFHPSPTSHNPQMEELVRIIYNLDERSLKMLRAAAQAAADSQAGPGDGDA